MLDKVESAIGIKMNSLFIIQVKSVDGVFDIKDAMSRVFTHQSGIIRIILLSLTLSERIRDTSVMITTYPGIDRVLEKQDVFIGTYATFTQSGIGMGITLFNPQSVSIGSGFLLERLLLQSLNGLIIKSTAILTIEVTTR